MTHYLRKPEAIIVTNEHGALVLDGAKIHALTELDHAAMVALLERTGRPIARDELELVVEGSTIDLLCEIGFLIAGSENELLARIVAPAVTRLGARLVVAITGAVGAAEMIAHVRRLRQAHFDQVDVIMTAAAQRFAHAEAYEYYGIPVWTDPFGRRDEARVPHIHLAQAASLVLVMPASAHALYELAYSTCGDLMSLTVAATRAPVVIVPSMNESMWLNPGVQDNAARLRKLGHHVVEPSFGVEISAGLSSQATIGGAGVSGPGLALLLAAILNGASPSLSEETG